MTSLILASIGVFLGVILLLVIILLVAKGYLTPSGEVTITAHCWIRCLPTVFSSHQHVVVKVLADSAVARFLKEVVKYFLRKPASSPVNNRPITGVWVAR